MTADVLVVGAGICGAACALELQDRGARVLLLDRGEVAMGTTGLGEGNVLAADKPPGPELELARAGRAVWHELAARFPAAVKLRAKGALVLFEDDGAAAFAAGLGADAEVVDDPRATAQAMAAEVPVRTGAEVVRAEAGGVELADGERLAADAVVVAAGPWTASLVPELDVRPRKGQLVALGPAPGLVRRKCLEAAYVDLRGVASVIEEALSGEVYVGSSRAWAGFDTTVDAAVTEQLLTRARRWMPGLADLPVTRTWAGLRPFLAGGPVHDRLPSGVWACTGHEGAGVGLGPVTARLLADALLGVPSAAYPARRRGS